MLANPSNTRNGASDQVEMSMAPIPIESKPTSRLCMIFCHQR